MATSFSDHMKLALTNFERQVGPTKICNSNGNFVPLVIKCAECDTKIVNHDGALCGIIHVMCVETGCKNASHYYIHCDKRYNHFDPSYLTCDACRDDMWRNPVGPPDW